MALKVGSIVSNIVQKGGTFDQKIIDESIERLSKKSEHLKGELYELVKRSYVDFDSYVSISTSLEQRAELVKNEFHKISARMDQDLNPKIAETFHKKEEIESQLSATRSQMVLVQHLVDIYQGIEASRADILAERYKAASQKLHSGSNSLSVLAERGCDALVFRALKSELSIVTGDLVVQLEQEWQKYILWNPKVIPSKPSLEFLSDITLQFPVLSPEEEYNMRGIIGAMKQLSSLHVWDKRAKLFANKLLKLFLKPVIVYPSMTVKQTRNKKNVTVHLVRTESQTSVVQLFDILLSVVEAIGIVVADFREEWLRMVGCIICPEIEELVVAHRLSTSIPRSLAELEDYEVVQAKIKEFEGAVTTIGLIEEGQMEKMSRYAKDINSHFILQRSQDMLAKARAILMKPIDDVTVVPTTKSDSILKLNNILKGIANEGKGLKYGNEFSNLTFQFPQCSVSKSVQEYVDLLYGTLKECVDSTSASTGLQHFHIARNMVDLFSAVMPTYHSSLISGSPRAAAIQYNNCMYLAHYLITLGHQYYSQLPPPLNQQSSTFVDYIPIIRQLGDDCLSSEIKRQCTHVLQCLKTIRTFSKVSSDDHREVVWQSMQETVFKIEKVSKAYRSILPKHVHFEVMGKILDVFLLNVVQMVLYMEDIAAADAIELHALLKMLVSRSVQVLLIPDKIENAELLGIASKSWERLKCLSIVLDASLLDIVDMWSAGSGSLAKRFTVSEARGLIKALFKNTERRAAALNKITEAI